MEIDLNNNHMNIKLTVITRKGKFKNTAKKKKQTKNKQTNMK